MKPSPASAPETPLPLDHQRENLPAGHIGYYNHQRFPLSFTSNFSTRGVITIDGGKAVVDGNGLLVEYDTDLERMVRDKLLKRIIPSDPLYKKFSEEATRSRKRVSVAHQPVATLPVGQPEQVAAAQELGYSIETEDGVTYYVYDSRRFTSLAAMNAYVKAKESP